MNKRIIGDMFLNIFASMIPIVILQFVISPMLASCLSSDEYGMSITILSLLNLIPATFGNVLNNIRLLYNDSHKHNDCLGDYSILFLLSEIISAVIIGVGCLYYYKSISIWDVGMVTWLSILWLAREYFIVAFRLTIDYKAILNNNVMLSIGYIFGILIYKMTNEWMWIYISGYILAVIYLLKKTSLWTEKLVITPMFKTVLCQALIYLLATFLPRVITVADKLLVYPLLGGEAVSIYYIATILGNVVSLIITPVANVMLSYLAKEEEKNDKMFMNVLMIGLVICTIGYAGCVMLSRPVLNLLYPLYVDAAMKYIPLTSGAALVALYTALISPFLIKFLDLRWQVIINLLTIGVYVGLGGFLLNLFGLLGICITTFASNMFKLVVSVVAFLKEKKGDESVKVNNI